MVWPIISPRYHPAPDPATTNLYEEGPDGVRARDRLFLPLDLPDDPPAGRPLHDHARQGRQGHGPVRPDDRLRPLDRVRALAAGRRAGFDPDRGDEGVDDLPRARAHP